MNADELRRLLAADEDGPLSASDGEALEAALEDPEGRRVLVEHHMLTSALREHLAALRENQRRLGRHFAPPRLRRRLLLAAAVPAAALVALLIARTWPSAPQALRPRSSSAVVTTGGELRSGKGNGRAEIAQGEAARARGPLAPVGPGATPIEAEEGQGAVATTGAAGGAQARDPIVGTRSPAGAHGMLGENRPVALLRRAPRRLIEALRGKRADGNGMVGENRREWRCPDDQRNGVRLVLTGVVLGRPELVDEGLRVAEMTFARQRPEGDFEDGDSVCLAKFVGETSHALLSLRESGVTGERAARLEALLPPLERAVAHLSMPGQLSELRGRGRGFQSHLFAAAETFAHAGLLLGRPDLVRLGREFLDGVIATQRADGAFPMRDGTDSVYQGVMLFFLGRWLSRFPNPRHEAAQQRGIEWLRGRIAADGAVDVTGNTEVCVDDQTRCGAIDWPCIAWALVYYGAIHGDSSAFADAERVLASHRVLRRPTP